MSEGVFRPQSWRQPQGQETVIVAAAGSNLALPSQMTYIKKGGRLDGDRARAAEAQVKEWRERHELWLPRFPREKIIEIDNTLEYPAGGSSTGAGRQ